MFRLSGVLSILALGAIVTAAPPPFSKVPLNSATTSAIAPKATENSSTSAAAPVATGPISIPDSVIDAAPIQDISTDNTLVSIPGIVSNSTLLDARPDLQTYVNSANVTGNSTVTRKRDLTKRSANPNDCNPNQVPWLSFDVSTWEHIALKICRLWYPNSNSFEYDPASPWPIALKSSVLGPINVGGGQIVTLSFTYGVNDWDLQADYGWEPYYVPQSQALCIADLNTLIVEMDNVCAYDTGYDTSQDLTGTGQPKWYTFIAS